MLTINTHFNPLRMKIGDKKPVQLGVELLNRGDRAMMLTMDLAVAKQLSLDKSGIVTSRTQKIDKFLPLERKQFYFDIYPKRVASAGEQAVLFRVMEHYRDWKFVEKTHTKRMGLRVVE